MRNRLSTSHWISLYGLNLLVCYLAGKDYNWDLLNYHFYGPALLLEGRWGADYFAGSIQSYLNPVSYVPFYLMVRAQWPALLIGLVLSSIHFLNIVLIGAIGKKMLSAFSGDNRLLVYAMCLVAMVAPAYLQANGSSFNDPFGSIFILLGLHFLMEDSEARSNALLVGLCAGIATGIKLTSAIFAIAFAIIFLTRELFWCRAGTQVLSTLSSFVGGALIAFLLIHGFWSWCLWSEFGSPVFPFFNAIFKAPEFPFENNRDFRFLGSGFLGLLFLPFEMARAQSWIYSEAVSPDFRPSVLVVLGSAALFLSAWRLSRSGGARKRFPWKIGFSVRWTPAFTVIAFFIVAFLLWGIASRIGRYAFSLWILIGPLLGFAAIALGGLKFARVTLLTVIFIQAYLHLAHGSYRWTPLAWESRWLNFELPAKLTEQPVGIISTDTLSFSAIVPSLHPGSGMTTISGMHTISTGAEMPERLKSLIGKYQNNLYVLYAIGQFEISSKTQISAARLKILDQKLAPYGLTLHAGVKAGGCDYGRLPFNRKMHTWSPESGAKEAYVFAFCKLEQTSPEVKAEAIKKSRIYDSVFDLIEDKCPETFAPKRVTTIHHNDEYVRSYFNTASGLYTDHGALYMTGYRILFPTYVGQLDELMETVRKPDFLCPSLPAHRYLVD